MAKEKTEGQKGSEWGTMQWIKWSAGLGSAIMAALLVALPASGILEPNSAVVVIMGLVASVLAIVAGKAAETYSKGRVEIKVAKAYAEDRTVVAGTPTLIDLDELKKLLKPGDIIDVNPGPPA